MNRIPPARFRASRIALLAGLSVAPPALAAGSFTVPAATGAQTVGNNDTGSIAAGNTLSAPTTITWTGGSTAPGVVITNDGAIIATTRGIDTSKAGTFDTGSFEIDNNASGTLIATKNDAFHIDTNIKSGTITVNNAGLLLSGPVDAKNNLIAGSSGQALDFAAITTSTAVINITNNAGAIIGASGDDAIRPGSGTITIVNSGTIDASLSANRAINLKSGGSLADILSFSLTNNAGGTIQSQDDAVRITAATLPLTSAGIFSIDNSGAIKTTGTSGGQAIDFNDLVSPLGTITITNRAGGTISAADGDAIRPGTNATVNNYGTIAGKTTGDSGNDGIDFQNTGTGAVNNYAGGTITGARHGITGNQAIAIYNEGPITGQDGSGINFDTVAGTVTVENHGVITGNAVTQDGDGIDVDYVLTLKNYGTVKAAGIFAGDINEAVAIGGGEIDNYAGGLITSVQRAITVDNSALGPAFAPVTIFNQGTIEGDDGEAISVTSTFANTLTNKGAIIGSVTLGAGADTFDLYTGSSISGAIDGGGGDDAIHLLGAAAGELGDVTKVATLGVDGGAWTTKGTETYSAGATIAPGATLLPQGTINGNITNNGTVKVNGGAPVFNGTFTNNGAYISDPSTQSFTTLAVGTGGYIKASAGDLYKLSGDFLNQSTDSADWNTSGAILDFTGTPGTSHLMELAAADTGRGLGRAAFDWAELVLDPGNTLTLGDGVATPVVAFYVRALPGLDLTDGFALGITGSGFNIYYNPNAAENAYLNGLTYALAGGGELIAGRAPEPAPLTVLLPGLGILALGFRRRSKA